MLLITLVFESIIRVLICLTLIASFIRTFLSYAIEVELLHVVYAGQIKHLFAALSMNHCFAKAADSYGWFFDLNDARFDR